MGASRRDVIRLQLAMVDILMLWRDALGEKTHCIFRCGSRMGRMYVEILVLGERSFRALSPAFM